MGRSARLGDAIGWYEPGSSAAERRLLFKVDFFVLSFLCLQFFVNYLDRSNFTNAYVSGMREALHFKGKEFNNVTSCFVAGYAIAQIPQNLLLLVVPPRILFAANCLVWGGLTMVSAAAKTVPQMYIIKFFQGCAEASTFVGAQYIFGAWYKPSEICKRAAIFGSTGSAATIFSGVLQSALYSNLNGVAGLQGWQWLFIVCGLITVPVSVYGLLLFPDLPTKTSAGYFSSTERELAMSRVSMGKPAVLSGKKEKSSAVVRRLLVSWQLWMFGAMWILGGTLEGAYLNGLFPLWMLYQKTPAKKPVYSVQHINLYPTGIPAVAIIFSLALAFWTDNTQNRHHGVIFVAFSAVISASLMLAVNHVSTGTTFLAFYLTGISVASQAVSFSWANRVMQGDDIGRSFLLAGMNALSYGGNTILSLYLFPASHAPSWTSGKILILVAAPLSMLIAGLTRMMEVRDIRKKAIAAASEGSEGSEGKVNDVEGDVKL